MTIQSNKGSKRFNRNFRRPFATSSVGLCTVRPLGMKNRFSIGPLCMTANSSTSPSRYSASPGVEEVPSAWCSLAPRRSASINRARRPCWRTITCARFAATKDLPSLGRALVTSSFRQRLFLAHLVKPRAQGAEFLGAIPLLLASVEEEHGLHIRRPVHRGAACKQGIECE